jgi:putative FmdB family regulatory protein
VPTYQYACTDCGREHEAVQAFSDPSLTQCPTCGGSLRKIFGAVGVVFKGSGFYRNDSRPPRTTGSDASDKSTNDGKAESKESKGSSDTSVPASSTESSKPPTATPAGAGSSAPAAASSTSAG